MLVLLPPSEGKTAPPAGAPVDLATLWAADALTATRARLAESLSALGSGDDAAAVLGVGRTTVGELARHADLLGAPAAPAAAVYTGVLHAAAGLGDLDARGRRRADERVRVLSGLWGALRPSDRIPAYRLPMGTRLPDVGPVAAAWRPVLGPVLEAAAGPGGLVVDCRSADYVAAWRTPRTVQHVAVVVVREVAGRRTVVTHWAKHARGVLTGHLVRRASAPRSPGALLEAAQELVGAPLLAGTHLGAAELAEAGRGAHRLTLVVV